MSQEVQVEKTGEDAIVKETNTAENYANYMAYQKLLSLNYTKQQCAEHLSVTEKQLDHLEDTFDPGDQ